jgi:hypothetical protein
VHAPQAQRRESQAERRQDRQARKRRQPGVEAEGMVVADGGNIALMAEDGSNCGQTWDAL